MIKSLILLSCFVFFLAIVTWEFSFAQTLSSASVTVKVATDKISYVIDEPIIITITAVNSSDKDVNLNFSSSKQTDYVIDGKFRWSSDKGFLTVLTEITVPARGEYTWTMTHKNSDYPLAAGPHTIIGEVVGYGSAAVNITIQPPLIPEYSESFENSFGGWIPDHQIDCEDTIPPSCVFNWSIKRSTQRAYDGIYSLEGYLDGSNDDGTIWVERPFALAPNSVVDQKVSFYLWSEFISITKWPVVAYIGLSNPERERDFNIIGGTDEAAGWKRYAYETKITTDSTGIVWVAFGFGATWEAPRTYFLDFVQVGAISGDLNNDSKVNIIDLGILLSNWSSTSKSFSDINQDSRVDVVDLGILLSNWG